MAEAAGRATHANCDSLTDARSHHEAQNTEFGEALAAWPNNLRAGILAPAVGDQPPLQPAHTPDVLLCGARLLLRTISCEIIT
jgi:hypothetical protein